MILYLEATGKLPHSGNLSTQLNNVTYTSISGKIITNLIHISQLEVTVKQPCSCNLPPHPPLSLDQLYSKPIFLQKHGLSHDSIIEKLCLIHVHQWLTDQFAKQIQSHIKIQHKSLKVPHNNKSFLLHSKVVIFFDSLVSCSWTSQWRVCPHVAAKEQP